MRTEERVRWFDEHGVRFLDELPDGWRYLEGATTAPNGWRWAGHGSLFPSVTGGEPHEHALGRYDHGSHGARL